MIDTNDSHDRALLSRIAHQAMLEKGFAPDFSPEEIAELDNIQGPAKQTESSRDLKHLPWCSIDNDDSLDLGL